MDEESVTGEAGGHIVRDAVAENRWDDAYEELSALDERSPMPPRGLDLLATAAYLTGHPEVARGVRLRAYHLYLAAGDRRAAARSAA